LVLVAQELDGIQVNQDNFPLPTLGPKLRTLSYDIHSGKGFQVIRGLDPDDFPVEDLTIIWLGIQAYIAEQRGRQDHRGNMLGICHPIYCANGREQLTRNTSPYRSRQLI
jgi:hypothetical protein